MYKISACFSLYFQVLKPLSEVGQNVMAVLRSDVRYSRYLALVLRNETLQDKLTNHGPFTLFVPTNQAFESLPERLLKKMTETDIADGKIRSYNEMRKQTYFAKKIREMASCSRDQEETGRITSNFFYNFHSIYINRRH